MATFEASRPTVGAQALGIARASYDYALEYAKNREQFGRPIIDNQAIAFKLAEMKMEIDAARLLVWRAAWMGAGIFRGETPKFANAEGSMAKLKAGQVATWASGEAIQILGGNGYTREYHGGALPPRLPHLRDLRGHLGDPEAGHLARHLRHPHPVTPQHHRVAHPRRTRTRGVCRSSGRRPASFAGPHPRRPRTPDSLPAR